VCDLCSVEVVSSSSLGIDLRWISVGTSYSMSSCVHVPFNMETSVDLANEELQLKYILPNSVSKRTMISVLLSI